MHFDAIRCNLALPDTTALFGFFRETPCRIVFCRQNDSLQPRNVKEFPLQNSG